MKPKHYDQHQDNHHKSQPLWFSLSPTIPMMLTIPPPRTCWTRCKRSWAWRRWPTSPSSSSTSRASRGTNSPFSTRGTPLQRYKVHPSHFFLFWSKHPPPSSFAPPTAPRGVSDAPILVAFCQLGHWDIGGGKQPTGRGEAFSSHNAGGCKMSPDQIFRGNLNSLHSVGVSPAAAWLVGWAALLLSLKSKLLSIDPIVTHTRIHVKGDFKISLFIRSQKILPAPLHIILKAFILKKKRKG